MGAEQSSSSKMAAEIDATVNFYINGTPYRVDPKNDKNVFPESRLVDFIREKAGLTGTKFMCREGGCGACMVSVKTKSASGKFIVNAINSCLMPLLSCDGLDISTIESLGNKKEGYHPIQQQMAKFSATQCGFCTPGMIMNMYSLSENAKSVGVKSREIEDAFDGNICRCTGYRPILDACKTFSNDCSQEQQKKCNGDIEDIKCCQLKNKIAENKAEIQLTETLKFHLSTGEKWIKATSLDDLFSSIKEANESNLRYRLVAGNTSTGIYKNDGPYQVFIDIGRIPELNATQFDSINGITLGGGVTLSKAILFLRRASQVDGLKYAIGVSKHIRRIANTGVRNAGSIAGNLMIKHDHPEFPSDLFVVLESLGAEVKIAKSTDFNNSLKSLNLQEFMKENMNGCIILSINLSPLPRSFSFRSYKISRRFQNAHAYVNAGFLMEVDRSDSYKIINEPNIVFGGISPNFIHAENTERLLSGKSLLDPSTIAGAMKILKSEVVPEASLTDGSVEYRLQLAQSLLYKCILSILGQNIKPELHSGGKNIQRNLTSGKQTYDTDESVWPISKPITKVESAVQCSGEAEFVNDLSVFKGELFASYVLSSMGNADIKSVDSSEAMELPGVVKFIQASDIPGENDYYVPIFPGTTAEEIFASKKVLYVGQAIGLILAETKEMASKASKLVKVEYENIQKPILFEEALILKKSEMKGTQDSAVNGFTDMESSPSSVMINGEFSIGSQYHFHMETQNCICIPKEDGMDVYTACQFVDFVQGGIAKALNVSNNSINITVRRLGGSYGSKATRTGYLATACAIGAYVTNRPVRLVLDLETNMEMIGKRVPYTGKYQVNVDKNGKIQHLKTDVFGDFGFNANDESPDEVKTSMQNCYNPQNWKISTNTVLTNTAGNTWCRAPGTTQGIALIENIMEHIAFALKMDPMAVRLNNLLQTGQESMGSHGLKGSKFEGLNMIPAMYKEIKQTACLEERIKLVEEFNKVNRWKKRGISVVPMKYILPYMGLNYPVFVAIYKHDGTIAVCHGGAECGQGINTKVCQAVAHKLGVPVEKVKVKPYNNLVCANAAVTGGSWTSELCCYAAGKACDELLERIEPVKKKLRSDTPWEQIIGLCGRMGVDLTASYSYNSEDPIQGYDIWAVNVTEVEVDILTGEYKIARVDILEDAGRSLNPEIDIGQVEGAVVFGLGLWTTEKIIFDKNTGKLLTNNTWTYKAPLVRDIPEDFRVTLLKNSLNQLGVLGSKASGEPPLCTTVCVLFALKNAIIAARKDAGNTDWFELNGPVTPEDLVKYALVDSSQFTL